MPLEAVAAPLALGRRAAAAEAAASAEAAGRREVARTLEAQLRLMAAACTGPSGGGALSAVREWVPLEVCLGCALQQRRGAQLNPNPNPNPNPDPTLTLTLTLTLTRRTPPGARAAPATCALGASQRGSRSGCASHASANGGLARSAGHQTWCSEAQGRTPSSGTGASTR